VDIGQGRAKEVSGWDRFLTGLDGVKVLEEFWAGVGKWNWCCGTS
jgi:hypothetical protein